MTALKRIESTTVEISGKTYQIRSSESDAYMARLADLINGKIKEIEQRTTTVDSMRVIVLAALNIADDYCKMVAKFQLLTDELNHRQNILVKKIDAVIQKSHADVSDTPA